MHGAGPRVHIQTVQIQRGEPLAGHALDGPGGAAHRRHVGRRARQRGSHPDLRQRAREAERELRHACTGGLRHFGQSVKPEHAAVRGAETSRRNGPAVCEAQRELVAHDFAIAHGDSRGEHHRRLVAEVGRKRVGRLRGVVHLNAAVRSDRGLGAGDAREILLLPAQAQQRQLNLDETPPGEALRNSCLPHPQHAVTREDRIQVSGDGAAGAFQTAGIETEGDVGGRGVGLRCAEGGGQPQLPLPPDRLRCAARNARAQGLPGSPEHRFRQLCSAAEQLLQLLPRPAARRGRIQLLLGGFRQRQQNLLRTVDLHRPPDPLRGLPQQGRRFLRTDFHAGAPDQGERPVGKVPLRIFRVHGRFEDACRDGRCAIVLPERGQPFEKPAPPVRIAEDVPENGLGLSSGRKAKDPVPHPGRAAMRRQHEQTPPPSGCRRSSAGCGPS